MNNEMQNEELIKSLKVNIKYFCEKLHTITDSDDLLMQHLDTMSNYIKFLSNTIDARKSSENI